MSASNSSHVPLFCQEDIVPDIYVAPPPTLQSEAALAEKLPLMSKICETYISIRVPPDARPCSWSRSGRGYKKVTSWMHGLLFTMSIGALEYLVENLNVAEEVCDKAQLFIFFCSGNPRFSDWHTFRHKTWIESRSTNPEETGVENTTCIISKKKGAIRHTYIMPARTHNSAAAKQLLESLDVFPATLFDARIAERILVLLAAENVGPFTRCNTIRLNPYLSQLFDAGFLALRPLALTTTTTKKPEEEEGPCGHGRREETHRVHFSVHWMPQTSSSPNDLVGMPCRHDIKTMLYASREYSRSKNELCEFDAVTNKPILDGHECFVEHRWYGDAEDMYVLLAFRWSVTLAMCLAGGIGLGEEEVFTDYAYSGDEEEEVEEE
ncbi:hypothetical protein PWT90_04943 [Aphanocladium album]|nr:hypothetical protein PWT90_04943 [Aphanocladium album]